jgi:hypothetical protein
MLKFAYLWMSLLQKRDGKELVCVESNGFSVECGGLPDIPADGNGVFRKR